MATLLQINDLATADSALRKRFAAARLKSAWDVLNEANNTANHDARLIWATKIVMGYSTDIDREFRRALANSTLQAAGDAATDNDLLFVVASNIDTWAV